MEIRILHIDDDKEIRDTICKVLTDEEIGGYKVANVESADFGEGIEKLKNNDFDVVILDLCEGALDPKSEKAGENLLKEIQAYCFVPIIFFTGLTEYVLDKETDLIRVVNKNKGIEELQNSIDRVLKTMFVDLRKRVDSFTREAVRTFFWDFIHPEYDNLVGIKDEVSLGYLLLRNLANSLSKDRIKELLGDEKIIPGKAHAMEMYLYPLAKEGDFELGQILIKEKEYFLILTPSCDLVPRGNKGPKADFVLLVKLSPLERSEEYKKYKSDPSSKSAEKGLKRLLESRKADQFFFLPQTPFVPHLLADFQKKTVVPFSELGNLYRKVACLDSPFAESVLARFVRYYNRVGTPDLDSDAIISSLILE